MKIYIGHSSSMNYREELYEPIRRSRLNNEHTFILPHEHSENPGNTYELLASCDLLIAEISEKSTGLGIELGWADRAGVPIVCLSKEGAIFSLSVKTVCDRFFTYRDSVSLITVITEVIAQG
jgi:hypothetical protein